MAEERREGESGEGRSRAILTNNSSRYRSHGVIERELILCGLVYWYLYFIWKLNHLFFDSQKR